MSDTPDPIRAACGHVSHTEAREIAARYHKSHWHSNVSEAGRARYSIPANPKRDDDIRLAAYIDQCEANEARERAAVEALQSMEAFVSIMVGKGPDATIPETVTGPLGVPIKVGAIMRETRAALALYDTP